MKMACSYVEGVSAVEVDQRKIYSLIKWGKQVIGSKVVLEEQQTKKKIITIAIWGIIGPLLGRLSPGETVAVNKEN